MNSNKMRVAALALLVGAATQVVAAPAPVTELNSSSAQGSSLERLERMLEARNQVQIDMQRQLEQLASEMDELRGVVERNSYDLSQMLERQRELYREVDALSRQPQKATDTADAKPKSTETYTGNVSENADYEKAVNLILKEKDYDGAVKAFEGFLASYPESAYKPNAHYWLGQLYFTKNQLKQAGEQFKAVASYSDSNKRADAMLKLGVIAERSKDVAEAKKMYQEVVKSYPDSTSSRQAQANLKKLGN
ncbi:tol-pal system protein [Photobacterium jeanii]|uniref:Cell division coordinator CpoB n=1 Tax=Photobacterium jeanii TaxID=858640 RepID=A0A178KNU7_9GAMM|nr:tol-pal system protein YbgF [Photobacterium jeanii]OAN18424.1 tol-pal system protein [Photobacterium jeanii]PST91895.1 tol-pal system protein YbgF [Photobacterium jeanii]